MSPCSLNVVLASALKISTEPIMLTAPQTTSTKLDNGLRVITERVPHTRSAAISVLVDAGPQDEPDDKPGLAHLCEHSLFLGTPQRSGLELAEMIDTAGGCFGAFTAPDYTCFYAHVLEDYASYALDLIGDILVASTHSEELLAREKEVICQEILGYQDDPQEILLSLNKNSLWPRDTLSRSVTGSASQVLKLQRSDVLQFLSQHYTPDRIIVAAAGNIEHDSIVEQTQDAFWALRGRSSDRSRPQPRTQGGVSIHTLPTSHCSFSIAIPTLAYADERRYALHVINNLIGGGISSRLYQCLRESHGLVYSVQSTLLAYRRGGALLINGSSSVENLVQSVCLALTRLTALAIWDEPIDEEELWKSKMQVRSQSRLATDLISNRVSGIATQEFHFGRRISDDQIVAEIDAVSIAELQQIAGDVLLGGLAPMALSVVGPLTADNAACDRLHELHEYFASLGHLNSSKST